MVTQDESYLMLVALISVVLLIVFFVKLFEIAKTLKEIRDRMPDKKDNKKAP
ncbi:MAG TPA: hypothetical protein GXZ87_07595 [Bacteroidales bacterium]|nr:hypothetical protein [Bacteroidales bacterium]